jgi:sugar lactone lactonase YvrE
MRYNPFLLIALGLIHFGCAAPAQKPERAIKNLEPGVVWQVTDGVQAPESAYLDKASGFLFVSQIGAGGGTGKDDDGWITKMTPGGKVIQNKWVTGFSAPKGLRSYRGTLWVTDITRIVAIDIKTAKITRSVEVKDAKFLNDLTIDKNGVVYFSDTIASKIYRYKGGTVELFDGGANLEHPNGLLIDGGELIVAAWGREIQDDFTSKTPGHLMAINLRTGKRRKITPTGLGNLDGLESDGKGGYIVSDWIAGKIYQVDKNGKARLVATRDKGAADLAYFPKSRLIILPEMLKSRITALKLK